MTVDNEHLADELKELYKRIESIKDGDRPSLDMLRDDSAVWVLDESIERLSDGFESRSRDLVAVRDFVERYNNDEPGAYREDEPFDEYMSRVSLASISLRFNEVSGGPESIDEARERGYNHLRRSVDAFQNAGDDDIVETLEQIEGDR